MLRLRLFGSPGGGRGSESKKKNRVGRTWKKKNFSKSYLFCV